MGSSSPGPGGGRRARLSFTTPPVTNTVVDRVSQQGNVAFIEFQAAIGARLLDDERLSAATRHLATAAGRKPANRRYQA